MSENRTQPASEARGGDATAPVAGSGLLDLAIDLSTPEVFSGKEFSVFLRIKNPFSAPVWIQGVTVNVPSAIDWLDRPSVADESPNANAAAAAPDTQVTNEVVKLFTERFFQQRQGLLDHLYSTTSSEDGDHRSDAWEIESQIRNLDQNLQMLGILQATAAGRTVIAMGIQSAIDVDISKLRDPAIFVGTQSRINLRSDPEQVPLTSSLPINAPLQPGNSAVWTIRFTTKRDLFFLPSKFRLELTVLYSFENPRTKPADDLTMQSNNCSLDLRIRSSVWSSMVGSCAGAFLGCVARAFQVSKTWANFVDGLGTFFPALVLAVILGVAATIFSARKSDVQSFVTVEDFWGGALIGFLVGYSGTAAFQNLTGLETPSPGPS